MKNIFLNLKNKIKEKKHFEKLKMIENEINFNKQRLILKKKIWELLLFDKFEVNHLQHYKFFIEGRIYVYGILELLSIFGDSMFHQLEKDKIELIKTENKKLIEKTIVILNI